MTRLRVVAPRVLLALCMLAAPLALRTGVASAASTVTAHARDIADATVTAAHPRTNSGGSTRLAAGRGAVTYLRLAVRGLPRRPVVHGVRLWLRVTHGSATGFTVHRVRVGGRWTEHRVTWRNRPGYYPRVLARQGPLTRTGWLRLTLPRTFVTRNGNYAVAIVGSGWSTVRFASRESRTRPHLDVVVTPVAPTVLASPAVTGTPSDGALLQVTPGRYGGYPAPLVRRQWLRCDSTGAGCAATGATGPSYSLTSADVGHVMRLRETATNVAGRASRQSPPTAVVAPVAPTSAGPPAVQGQPVVGQTLTSTTGDWQGTTPMSYAFQWLRCAADGTACQTVPGADGSSFGPIGAADVGSSFAVAVTATNQAGSTASTSAATAPTTDSAPSPTATSPAPSPAPSPTPTPTTTTRPSPTTSASPSPTKTSPSPSPSKTTTSPSPSPSPSSTAPVIAAAGDIACDPSSSQFNGGSGTSSGCQEKATSNLLVNTGLAGVLDLGDNQYYCGSLSAFQQSYDPTWGRVKSMTHPAPGNHEYLTSGGTGCDSSNSGAAGYFNYFGSAAGPSGLGWYSFDIGSWHLISLDSNCGDVGGCSPSSPQGQWLASDLKSHSNFCTLAYWHIPLYSSGGRAESNMQDIYNMLYNANADLVLTGHDHIYERFAPQDAYGNLDTSRGIREFVVGTGGANHTSIASVMNNSEVRDDTTFGVLRVTLQPTSYSWKFVPDHSGGFTDSGSQSCH